MKQDIHAEAVRVLGKHERLEHLRKECIELAHEIDRYLDGKSNEGFVVAEAHDVEYIARSLKHIEEFDEFCNPAHQQHLDVLSELKLQAAIKQKCDSVECCTWTQDPVEDKWDTGCGMCWMTHDMYDRPADVFGYCPYCGKRIVEAAVSDYPEPVERIVV
jgi:PHP family Zn ribbon phosphoesterase